MCLIGDCAQLAKQGAQVCADHLHSGALQQEIQRLQALQPRALRHPDLRRLVLALADLEERAFPMKAASSEVVARSRSHNLGDGIVILGDHRAIPGYAVSSYSDSGRLGAALSKVARVAREVEQIADPNHRPTPDPRPRCGSRKCSQPNRRQPAGSKFCAYCGRPMKETK